VAQALDAEFEALAPPNYDSEFEAIADAQVTPEEKYGAIRPPATLMDKLGWKAQEFKEHPVTTTLKTLISPTALAKPDQCRDYMPSRRVPKAMLTVLATPVKRC
jgi:hypothetical protein